ncbi:ATP-binding protein [Paraconexibacter sp.]|uniref:ATP-binding protein n=1 Tax=Paraconexibacter sp. TaxID=2949640 RepID=UPI00356B10C3
MSALQDPFTLTLPARATSLAVVRHVLGGAQQAWSIDPDLLDDVRLAVAEACIGVVMRADADGARGLLEVHGGLDHGHVVVAVRDTGTGRASPTDGSADHLELTLIDALTEHVSFGLAPGGGREIRMTFPPSA